ncbi:hypothetical protein [Zunongwangia sp.]|uniref:hypothetical protein n=1 Tax=Zunongwangia sp. TaxID=1965325 RepID=UPI003AA856BE
MKKTILSTLSTLTITALFFATQTISAQEPVEKKQDTISQNQEIEEGFSEIEVIALPQAIKDAVMIDFSAIASKAWVNHTGDKKVYKLSIQTSGDPKIVYADKEGNWIKKEDI